MSKKVGRPQNKHLKPFKKGETTPAHLKREGWKRRQEAQRIMDRLKDFGNMSLKELEKYMQDNKETITLQDAIVLKYAQDAFKDKKMTIDYLNRHVPYAPTKTELTGEDGGSIEVTTMTPKQLKALEALRNAKSNPSKG